MLLLHVWSGQFSNDFVDTLSKVFEEGRAIDDASMLDIPIELLQHLDEPIINNPDFYQLKMFEDIEQMAQNLKTKLAYLDVSCIRTLRVIAIDQDADSRQHSRFSFHHLTGLLFLPIICS